MVSDEAELEPTELLNPFNAVGLLLGSAVAGGVFLQKKQSEVRPRRGAVGGCGMLCCSTAWVQHTAKQQRVAASCATATAFCTREFVHVCMNAWHGTGQEGTGVRTCCAVRALGSEGRIDADLGPGSHSGASFSCSYLARHREKLHCTALYSCTVITCRTCLC